MAVALFDGVQGGYYDSSTRRAEPKTEWIKKLMQDDPQHLQWYADQSLHTNEDFKHYIGSLRQRFNQTGGMDLSNLLLLKIFVFILIWFEVEN